MNRETMSLPMVALRGITILPEMVRHFDISRPKSIKAIEEVVEGEQKIFLTTQKDGEVEDPGIEDVYRIGCIATVRQIIKLPRKVSRVLITGETRACINTIEFEEPYLRAHVTVMPDADIPFDEAQKPASFPGEADDPHRHVSRDERQGMIRGLKDIFKEYMAKNPKLSKELAAQAEGIDDIKRLVDVIAANVPFPCEDAQQLLDALTASEEVKEKLAKEIRRFRNSMGSQAENGVIRTYIETMLEMPWDKMCEEHQDIEYAKQVLEADHYGLEKVKERVLEFLAVRALTKKGNTPILCLAGPPGTGKTSIARSLARALKKPYVRISLGGVRDEAEIRGHRKTYVGAMPGRIANGLRQAEVKNPLLLLDEIDKVSNDYKGDTFSALLEVLDSEQNRKFRDHYLEVPVDLSEVLFVTTANTLQPIPRPLLDRMEVIEVSSYTENEKMHIAMEHLIPKQLEKHGLKEDQLTISKKALWKMARNYTKEAGVRQLERKIGDICRKSAREILETKRKKIHVTERNLHIYLGKELYSYQMANEADEVGIVRGLAWTSVGGDTLQIEVNVMPGEGEILLTGQMGDVMKESARTGISYIRSVSGQHKIDEQFFKEHDVHIHIPEGAVPKDGPSAGITMATAMMSAVTGRKARADLAMTGEITLRGRVLPIGGLKEKLLAAKNAGIKTVLIPKENESDTAELSGEITKGLKIIPVSHMDEVLKIALTGKAVKQKNKRTD